MTTPTREELLKLANEAGLYIAEEDGDGIALERFAALLSAHQAQGEPVTAWIATDLDGRGDVGFTKAEAQRRAGEGCTYFYPLVEPIAAPPSSAQTDQVWNEAVEDAKDAARYRWLRNPDQDVCLVLDKKKDWIPPDDSVPGVGGYWTYEYRAGDELDSAIDAALQAGKEKEHGN